MEQNFWHTLTPSEVLAKSFTLPSLPVSTTKMIVDADGGGSLLLNRDFSMSGLVFSWDGLTLDGLLDAGDSIRFQYLTQV